MQQPQCGTCGGVIGDLSMVSHRRPSQVLGVPMAHGGPCRCEIPVIYGPPAGYASMPIIPGARRPSPEPGAKVTRGPRRWG